MSQPCSAICLPKPGMRIVFMQSTRVRWLISLLVAICLAPFAFRSPESIRRMTRAELSLVDGRDPNGLCCSVGSGGPCAVNVGWTAGCTCSGVHCCSCQNPQSSCWNRVSQVGNHDQCIAPNPPPDTNEMNCSLSTVGCYLIEHGSCHDDEGGFNQFALCWMCGCPAGGVREWIGSVSLCAAGSSGCL
jgi:hypothetical protein